MGKKKKKQKENRIIIIAELTIKAILAISALITAIATMIQVLK